MNDERRLLRALARRDRAAWATIYDRHVRDLFGFVYHLVGGDRSLAEDLHQEVWLAALEGIERYDGQAGRFRDWLMGIARSRLPTLPGAVADHLGIHLRLGRRPGDLRATAAGATSSSSSAPTSSAPLCSASTRTNVTCS